MSKICNHMHVSKICNHMHVSKIFNHLHMSEIIPIFKCSIKLLFIYGSWVAAVVTSDSWMPWAGSWVTVAGSWEAASR
jgi:hypothetical protein